MDIPYSEKVTMQDAAQATGNGAPIIAANLGTVAMQVSGTFVATITFEATLDDTNWVAINVINGNSGLLVATATAPGIYLCYAAGFRQVRARISAYTSGSVTVAGFGTTTTGILDPAAYRTVYVRSYGDRTMYDLASMNSDDFNPAGHYPVGNALFHGTKWDRQRNNEALTLLASAARTATTQSSDQVNYNGAGLILIVDVSAIADTPSITPSLQIKDPVSGSYFTIWTAAAALTATGTVAYLFQPGGAAGSFTEAVNLRVSRTWRLVMTHADSDSATYSTAAVVLV